jgi:redox-sensitive bicupin YhaK (pirin superfamily)
MNDPFILLMDDHLDIGDRPVGGPHPHAGFETVTLILDGAGVIGQFFVPAVQISGGS